MACVTHKTKRDLYTPDHSWEPRLTSFSENRATLVVTWVHQLHQQADLTCLMGFGCFFCNQVQTLKQNTTKTTKKFDFFFFRGRPHFLRGSCWDDVSLFFVVAVRHFTKCHQPFCLGCGFGRQKTLKVTCFCKFFSVDPGGFAGLGQTKGTKCPKTCGKRACFNRIRVP